MLAVYLIASGWASSDKRQAIPHVLVEVPIDPRRSKCQKEGIVTRLVDRRTVDLGAYPDLVVIYLGMRVNALTGLRTLLGFRPRITRSVDAKPDGLLLHEDLIFSLIPLHLGMRQYWRDFDSLERWARSDPHRAWWQRFVRDSEGTGFWHEAYFMSGGMEAVYDDIVEATGFLKFAPIVPARGAMFSARGRVGKPGEADVPAPINEDEFYGAHGDEDGDKTHRH
jgi:hypothetical protein